MLCQCNSQCLKGENISWFLNNMANQDFRILSDLTVQFLNLFLDKISGQEWATGEQGQGKVYTDFRYSDCT